MNLLEDKEFLNFLSAQESTFILGVNEIKDRLHSLIENESKMDGDKLPWSKTWDLFGFREGEVTLWAGTNGSGKSLVMGQTALWLCNQSSVLIASMEMLPERTMYRIARQASGCEKPAKGYINRLIDYLQSKMWIYDQTSDVDSDKILAMVAYAAQKLKIKHIMIDSLVKCNINSEKNEPQKKFMSALCWCAKEYNIHIHLVHHVRKPMKPTDKLSKFDIKGAGELTDLASNVIIVTRSVMKQELIKAGKKKTSNNLAVEDLPDCYLQIEKQRNGEFEGDFKFWFHEKSQQWLSKKTTIAMPYPSPNNRL